MSQALAKREPRALGLAAQPSLRLALGFKDPAKRGAPTKTDYFVVKEGRDGEYAAAARKFTEKYGPKPSAIDIMLPTSITQALDVRYRAFKGNPADDDGGVLVAVGELNFAQLGVLGGPDTLTVWNQDGSVDHVDITGPDDPFCEKLGVQLYTTFRFGIPNVLGAAGDCEITSKGKKTTDNLFARLVTIYGWFGARTPFVVRPKLVLRPASARPIAQTKDGPRRIKSQFYALDIYVPESVDEMVERFSHQMQALPGGSAAAALYGQLPPSRPDRPAIEAVARSLTAAPQSDAPSGPEGELEPGTSEGSGQQGEGVDVQAGVAAESAVTGVSASSPPDVEPPLESEGGSPFQPPKIAQPKTKKEKDARIAALGKTPLPGHPDKTLAGVGAMEETVRANWIAWALGDTPNAQVLGDDFKRALSEYVQLALPELWEQLHPGSQMELSA